MDSEVLAKLVGLAVAAVAGVGGLLVFVAKTAISNQISKDLERFRIRFTKLHEQQADVIQKLYSAVVELEEDATNLYYKYMPVGLDPPEVDETQVIRRMRDLQSEVRKSRIYLDDDTCRALENVSERLSSGLAALEQRRIAFNSGASGSDDGVSDLEIAAFKEIRGAVPDAKNRLEAQFRRLLGTT